MGPLDCVFIGFVAFESFSRIAHELFFFKIFVLTRIGRNRRIKTLCRFVECIENNALFEFFCNVHVAFVLMARNFCLWTIMLIPWMKVCHCKCTWAVTMEKQAIQTVISVFIVEKYRCNTPILHFNHSISYASKTLNIFEEKTSTNNCEGNGDGTTEVPSCHSFGSGWYWTSLWMAIADNLMLFIVVETFVETSFLRMFAVNIRKGSVVTNVWVTITKCMELVLFIVVETFVETSFLRMFAVNIRKGSVVTNVWVTTKKLITEVHAVHTESIRKSNDLCQTNLVRRCCLIWKWWDIDHSPSTANLQSQTFLVHTKTMFPWN